MVVLTMPESSYVLAPACVFRPGPDATVVALVGRRAFSLEPRAFQTLAAFAAPRTIAAAHATLGDPGSLDALAATVAGLVAQGLLVGEGELAAAPAAWPTSLADALDPAVLARQDDIAAQLAAGRAVVIRDAMRRDLAERVGAALDAAGRWRVVEAFGRSPHYRHHVLDEDDAAGPAVADCRALFGAAASRDLAAALSGRDCGGPLELGATRYVAGDFAAPHADHKLARTVAFVWHLARDWDASWGGQFVWCPSGAQVVPSFNTLIVFNVAAETVHAVTPVSPYARGKRLGVTGWWSHAAGLADPSEPAGFARWGVGAASYGAQPLALDEARGLLAL
ncbi:2OG-Fe(II) oxygenase [Nannocystis pusilla]|uniref:2OG-Fe(II) oxygenase n=1 Tax=Nannocystis pusilla TaxID=889268 RepID=A0A9X3EYR6_9BACT|nr:2OG-Fe(II) oxygenase [Nannocystis pusilla]